ncbi:MAG: quinoprotein dehydrogenase-associated SoxYZ-like carrier [Betaproteobacteria bacterium]|nr:quinoprotein dehydrogenase-associated SoxYZ-like carrier [Betaproteobacteria bacterium]
MSITILTRRGLFLAAIAILLGVSALNAIAQPGGLPTNVKHTDSSPEWDQLREKLFPGRRMESAASLVQLVVPLRAAYGASVPVRIVSKLPQSEALYVKRITLLVDKNPSPVSAVLELTPGLGQADFETRLRVDEYSHIRVVSELSNGELHTDSRYVKVSGGCSAPPNRDQLHNIGKTILKLPEGIKPNEPTPLDLQVVHPNDTGFEMNQISLLYIPAHFVRAIRVTYAGRPLFDAELDFSISENPAFRFNFVPGAGGELKAEVVDSKEGRYVATLQVP